MKGYYKAVAKKLLAARYQMCRNKIGAHEVWKHLDTGVEITVSKNMKLRHAANWALKNAGIKERF